MSNIATLDVCRRSVAADRERLRNLPRRRPPNYIAPGVIEIDAADVEPIEEFSDVIPAGTPMLWDESRRKYIPVSRKR